jgi:hypothetical protein
MSDLDEHQAFQRIIDGLSTARDGALLLRRHQPDKAHMWEKMAQTYDVCRQAAFKLAEERAVAQTQKGFKG